MVFSCIYCGNFANPDEKISLHPFPKRETPRFSAWIRFLDMEPHKITRHSRLCSAHFENECLTKHRVKTVLKKSSVPTKLLTYKLRCVVCFKKRNSPGRFHKFPFAKDELLRRWLSSIPEYCDKITEPSFICSDHFTEDSYFPGGQLKPFAVPTIFPMVHRIKEEVEEPSPESHKYNDNDIDVTTTYITNSAHVAFEHKYHASPQYLSAQVSTLRRKLQIARSENALLKKQLARNAKSMSRMRDIIETLEIEANSKSNVLNTLPKGVDAFTAEFLQRFCDNGSRESITQDKYPSALRSFASTLYLYSPKAYNFIRSKLSRALPHESTIRAWCTTADGETSFTEEINNITT